VTVGVCFFCTITEDKTFYSSPLVLAIWDQFPVSSGHALIIPRRHCETWFDANPQEQAEIMATVAIVRQMITESLHPDGFNIGMNVGTTAGQTIPHLHVHLIPRYRGDVADPTGGVRSVIPGKANYLKGAPPPGSKLLLPHVRTLVTGAADPLLAHIRSHMDDASAVDIAVAFTLNSGLSQIIENFRDLLVRGGRLRFLTGDYLDVTEPDALYRLLDLEGSIELRIFETSGTCRFHPKTYIFHGSSKFAYVGSSNISASALGDGIEWNMRISDRSDPDGFIQVAQAFDSLFQHSCTRPLDESWIRSYEARRRVLDPRALLQVGAEVPEPVRPHSIQREALAALEKTREEGNTAGLVVLATGLGKTWLSAFDSCRPEYHRILFVAHRDEILVQAMGTFRRIRPGATLGKYTGTERVPDAEILFASIQTLGRIQHLSQFRRDAFDYIVVDEFHHASARTYRNLIDYFTPNFLLGLTATPERTDGGDLLALCEENLVYRCDIADGIKQMLLCPFEYFGVPDDVDYSNIPWRSSRFDEEALTNAVATMSRAENILEQYKRRGGRRTLAFCCSQRHADFMTDFFNGQGLRAAAVHSGATSAPRASSLERLEEGDLDIVCSVDMFNEGVDLPSVDTVMLLRPTESTILFLQQFGRGLRVSPDKQKLTVIDYIGNHRAFLLKPRALLGVSAADVDLAVALDKLVAGWLELPPGCSVTYDLKAIDMLRALIRTREGDELVKSYYLDFRERMGERPTASEAFHDGYSPRTLRQTYGSWLRFVRTMGDLSDEQDAALSANQAFFDSLETTPMTKSFKMLTLLGMLNEDKFPGEIPIAELTEAFGRAASRSPRFMSEIGVAATDSAALRKLLESNPIAAWTGGKGTGGSRYFEYKDGVFRSEVAASSADSRPALQELVREIVDWRIVEYLQRRSDSQESDFTARVSHAGGRPILFLDRKRFSNIPEGNAALMINERRYVGNFVKIALNVIHEEGSNANELPEIILGWFGPDAGRPGTTHEVSFSATDEEGVWKLSPVGRVACDKQPELWRPYMREEIPQLFGLKFNMAIWNSGFVQVPGHLFLLVTLKKEGLGEKFKYEDEFLTPDIFKWQSQNRTKQQSPHGELIRGHAEEGCAVHLFVRPHKRVGAKGAAPFTYCGDVDFVSWNGEAPITVHWKLRTPVPSTLEKTLLLRPAGTKAAAESLS
jgi:superfamily II DNA or RNA helicase/diadenosine tetraphosphate (Ap4A) HIT family hydrolase